MWASYHCNCFHGYVRSFLIKNVNMEMGFSRHFSFLLILAFLSQSGLLFWLANWGICFKTKHFAWKMWTMFDNTGVKWSSKETCTLISHPFQPLCELILEIWSLCTIIRDLIVNADFRFFYFSLPIFLLFFYFQGRNGWIWHGRRRCSLAEHY